MGRTTTPSPAIDDHVTDTGQPSRPHAEPIKNNQLNGLINLSYAALRPAL
jgi:hypothetical protein